MHILGNILQQFCNISNKNQQMKTNVFDIQEINEWGDLFMF